MGLFSSGRKKQEKEKRKRKRKRKEKKVTNHFSFTFLNFYQLNILNTQPLKLILQEKKSMRGLFALPIFADQGDDLPNPTVDQHCYARYVVALVTAPRRVPRGRIEEAIAACSTPINIISASFQKKAGKLAHIFQNQTLDNDSNLIALENMQNDDDESVCLVLSLQKLASTILHSAFDILSMWHQIRKCGYSFLSCT